MRKRYFIYSIILSVFFVIAGCKTSIDNSFRINNLAAAKVIVNFRAQAITVTPGGSAVIKEIPQGTYDYTTIYAIPAGAKGSGGAGLSGQVVINPGTRILLIYTSVYDTSGLYTISATMTSSDNQATTTSP